MDESGAGQRAGVAPDAAFHVGRGEDFHGFIQLVVDLRCRRCINRLTRPEHAETRFAQTVRAFARPNQQCSARDKGVNPQTIKDPLFGGLTEIDDPLRERSPEKKPFMERQ